MRHSRRWFADDGVELGNGDVPLIGKVAIVKSANWSPKDYQLTWTPTDAMMGPSGDMGYTWGHFEGHSKDANGNPVVTSGRYMTVWRREPDGSWKVVWMQALTTPGCRRLLQAAETVTSQGRDQRTERETGTGIQ